MVDKRYTEVKGMVINHSWIQQLLVNRDYEINTNKSKNSEKMASGVRMNRASDNCSGLAIFKNLHTRIVGLQRAARNAQDGVSMLQVVDGAVQDTQKDLIKMKELAVQSLNGDLTDGDKQQIQLEINQIKNSIDDTANNTEFNTIKVLKNNADVKIKVLDDPEVNYDIKLKDCTASGIGVDKIDITNSEAANEALKTLDGALSKVSGYLVSVGADENCLSHIQNSLETMSDNFTRSEANINDMDMAYGKMEDVRLSILQEATDAMFSQVGELSKQSIGVLNT